MSESKFIGRSEVLVKQILSKLMKHIVIQTQVPIEKLILKDDFVILDQEIKNHKFDLVIYRSHEPSIVVEVNYKHGAKAADKWENIFVPLIKKAGMIPLPINDYECSTLFHQYTNGEHRITWQDYIDVINAMVIVGIKPD